MIEDMHGLGGLGGGGANGNQWDMKIAECGEHCHIVEPVQLHY